MLVVTLDFVSGDDGTNDLSQIVTLSLRWVLAGGMETFLDAEPAVRDHLSTMHKQ